MTAPNPEISTIAPLTIQRGGQYKERSITKIKRLAAGLKQVYFKTSEVGCILHKSESIIIHACINHHLRVKRTKGNLRQFTVKDINNLWAILYGQSLRVKSVERVGSKYDLRLEPNC